MRATVVLCDQCQQAMVMVNGVSATALELRQVNGKPAVTPHAPDCPTLED